MTSLLETIKIENRNVNINELSKNELLKAKLELELDIDNIKGQLDLAKSKVASSGEYADPIWYRNATQAMRIKQKQLQFLMMKIKDKKECDLSIPQLFMNMAEKLLDEETFNQILESANDLKNR